MFEISHLADDNIKKVVVRYNGRAHNMLAYIDVKMLYVEDDNHMENNGKDTESKGGNSYGSRQQRYFEQACLAANKIVGDETYKRHIIVKEIEEKIFANDEMVNVFSIAFLEGQRLSGDEKRPVRPPDAVCRAVCAVCRGREGNRFDDLTEERQSLLRQIALMGTRCAIEWCFYADTVHKDEDLKSPEGIKKRDGRSRAAYVDWRDFPFIDEKILVKLSDRGWKERDLEQLRFIKNTDYLKNFISQVEEITSKTGILTDSLADSTENRKEGRGTTTNTVIKEKRNNTRIGIEKRAKEKRNPPSPKTALHTMSSILSKWGFTNTNQRFVRRGVPCSKISLNTDIDLKKAWFSMLMYESMKYDMNHPGQARRQYSVGVLSDVYYTTPDKKMVDMLNLIDGELSCIGCSAVEPDGLRHAFSSILEGRSPGHENPRSVGIQDTYAPSLSLF